MLHSEERPASKGMMVRSIGDDAGWRRVAIGALALYAFQLLYMCWFAVVPVGKRKIPIVGEGGGVVDVVVYSEAGSWFSAIPFLGCLSFVFPHGDVVVSYGGEKEHLPAEMWQDVEWETFRAERGVDGVVTVHGGLYREEFDCRFPANGQPVIWRGR